MNDLVTKVPTKDGGAVVVAVHLEEDGDDRADMERRLFDATLQLRADHGLPVLPLVVFRNGGPGPGVTWCAVEEGFAGHSMMAVHYAAFSLSRSRAEDHLEGSNPLGWALAALMSTDAPPDEHRERCLEAVEGGEVPEDQRHLLRTFVEACFGEGGGEGSGAEDA